MREEIKQRNHEIIRQIDAGMTYKAIGKVHGIHSSRVQQINKYFRLYVAALNRRTTTLIRGSK